VHRTVLLHEAIDSLSLQPDSVVVDATAGMGGHSAEIATRLSREGTLFAFDADPQAIEHTKHRIRGTEATTHLIVANFEKIPATLAKHRVTHVDAVLFDLGWGSHTLDSGRGFSFKKDEPLIMTYGPHTHDYPFTAATIVNEWDEENIADILFGWGEERFARRIARAIVEHRKMNPITTTHELASLVEHAVPGWYRHKKTHPATKTFQALRIAVNDELGVLERTLKGLEPLIHPHGRIAVITFHSLEDRLVKRLFRSWREEGKGKELHKKAQNPSLQEIRENPRARSARLRTFIG
jgi:16S rRNA (cytosine1402-N4)-methyltransferase